MARQRVLGFYAMTLTTGGKATRKSIMRYRDNLFRHLRRYARSKNMQFEIYGVYTNAHVSKGSNGATHFHLTVYGYGAATVAQEIHNVWARWFPNVRRAADKVTIFDLYDSNDDSEGWLGYIKKNYSFATDGLRGYCNASFGNTCKKTKKEREQSLCAMWDASDQKKRTRDKREEYRRERKEKDDDSFEEFGIDLPF